VSFRFDRQWHSANVVDVVFLLFVCTSCRLSRDEQQRDNGASVSVPSIDEFPTLGERTSASQGVLQQRGAWSADGLRGIYSSTDFPALVNETSNTSNKTAGQARSIWRESQPTTSTVLPSTAHAHAHATSKKSETTSNVLSSMNVKEDFPALQSASHSRIVSSASMISTWSNAKKSSKNITGRVRRISHAICCCSFDVLATSTTYQPQMRMNTRRFIHDDEDEEYIRRPMSELTSSTVPTASANITMISSVDMQTNGKSNNAKNQSVPKLQDFPALPTAKRTSTVNSKAVHTHRTSDCVRCSDVSAGVWQNGATASPSKTSTSQPKKKNGTSSKKKFMEEVQSMASTSSTLLSNDTPAMSLNELGRRLIIDENPTKVSTQSKDKATTSTVDIATNKSMVTSKKDKVTTTRQCVGLERNEIDHCRSMIVNVDEKSK
jgi:hypothetical protein